MKSYRKVLFIYEANLKPGKLYIDQVPKLAKGLVRLGHDARLLSYTGIMSQLSPFKSRKLSQRFYKTKTDETICDFAKMYQPDIVFIGFSRGLDSQTVQSLRHSVPNAIFFGIDGDPWPSNNRGRIELGCELDILFATNNGTFIDEYRQHGAKKCLFIPNMIDPDNDYRYEVPEKWHSNILWTGKIQHQAGIDAGEHIRQNVLNRFEGKPGVQIYGALGGRKIGGLNYLYAISGAKIGISINSINTVSMYHSDRFTHYSACGTLVLAKRVPDTDRLMQDGKHVRYFDSEEECGELSQWYLKHEREREKIANAGMQYCHTTYNSTQIASYILSAIETGGYSAPWGEFS